MKRQLSNWLEGRLAPAVFRVWQKRLALLSRISGFSKKPQAYFDNRLFSPFTLKPVFERRSESSHFSLVYTQLINVLVFLRLLISRNLFKSISTSLLQATGAMRWANCHHSLDMKALSFSLKPRKEF